jgi:hypothetical protein
MSDLFKNHAPTDLTDRELLESIYTMLCHQQKEKPPHKQSGATPKRRHKYEPAFEELWKAYPARNGSASKWKAQQCWHARIKETKGNVIIDGISRSPQIIMLNGVKRYAAWCEATGKTGTEMVMQAPRFLGPSKEYENLWDTPAPEVQVVKLPRENNELLKFAAERGIHPHVGESFWEFRIRVGDAI